jgi:sigma-B regulation protein RsbU (phosphoserine phosphatase)
MPCTQWKSIRGCPTNTLSTRFLEVGRILFWAMILKLSPARRVLLLLSLFVLSVPLSTFRYQGLTFWGGAGLLILLALELADRVMMKRDLEIAREIQNSMMPATPPAIPGIDIAFETRAANSVGGDYYDVVIVHQIWREARLAPNGCCF